MHEAMLPLNIYRSRSTEPQHRHHTDKLSGTTMSSTVVVVSAMFFGPVCLAAAPRASAAVTGAAGGILYIPSNDSLAHCPSSCGGVHISYPEGIGSGCFRQGLKLTCDHSTKPPNLFLGNTTTQLTGLYTYTYYTAAFTPMFFNIRMRPGMNTYLVSSPIPGVMATAAQSDQLHPGVMAFMSSRQYYISNASDLFSSWTDASKIEGAMLSIAIMDQPSCESAQSNNATYACSTNSNCRNVSSGGYYCYCSGYEQANPYLMNGCIDYNPKHKEHCPTSCGNMTIPFPFGLQEGCFANERFQLNCTAGNLTVFDPGDAHYHVTDVSVEDGTLTVSNMLSDTRSEEVIVQTDDIVIRWAVANLTCPMAMQKNNMYACRSVHSYCLNVTHKKIFLGYRCKCSSGFQGNPYLQDVCIDVDECQLPNYCNGTCENFSGSYRCTSCPHRKEFDPIKRQCVTSAKQRNLLFGIAIGIDCSLGSIIIALGAIVLANKWKKGVQKRIRRAYFKKNLGLLLEQLISDENATNKTKIFSFEV